MADMLEDFLGETQKRFSELDGLFVLLEKDPADEFVWNVLASFFDYIRCVSPFVGFMRSYRLSDVGLKEITEYFSKKNITALPPILMKYQRIKKIMTAAVVLKREPREFDNDLLPVVDIQSEPTTVSQNELIGFQDMSSDLMAQGAALDEREEQLVLWAQALTEQEASLKQKENILFEEEHRQSLSQERISAVLTRLSEQEKLQTDLEDHLAETRVALQSYQERLADQENQQQQTLELLETKNAALKEMSQKIDELTCLLGEKNNLSEQREEQLYQELKQNQQKAEELRINLETLEKFRSEINQDREQISSQYENLEKEYQEALSRLDIEKENTELLLKEKRELEKQHIEFNTRFIALQESLNNEKEQLKRTEKALEQQKKRNHLLWTELKAAAWPYNAEKIQKELAVLARKDSVQKVSASLLALKDVIGNIRTRSFSRIPVFLEKLAQKNEKKYQRQYKIEISNHVESGIDKEAVTVIEKILTELTDNVFRYAVPKENQKLKIFLNAQEEGAFLHFSFCDNGAVFDFDKLYNKVQKAGFIDANTTVVQKELLNYLFHYAVPFNDHQRGLIKIAELLEKAGGQINADFNNGLCVYFSVPKKFLFDKVLLFGYNARRFALPLNAVAETVFLQESEFSIKSNENTKMPFFYWKGLMLPVLNFTQQKNMDNMNYGLVVQSGIFTALLPVQQIFDTEHLLLFCEKNTGMEEDYFSVCTVLESGDDVLWLDLSKLWQHLLLPVPKKIISVQNKSEPEAKTEKENSYLIFKAEPSIFGAVCVDAVERVENFSFPPASLIHKKYFETQGKRLPLKDSCTRESYPYAQAVLIFDSFALAIQEVVDIINISEQTADEGQAGFIVYRGRKVKVFSTQN